MASIRPVSMKKLVSVIRVLEELGCASTEMLADRLGIGVKHLSEVLKFIVDLGLAHKNDDCYVASERGVEFVGSFENGDLSLVKEVLSKIPGYTSVASCAEKGYRKPVEIARCAGVSVFKADILLRLYREVCGLSKANTYVVLSINQEIFDKTLFEAYSELSTSKKSKYVHLEELITLVSSKLGIGAETVFKMLENTLKNYRSRIVLTRAPVHSSVKPVHVHGKPYTHIAVF